MRIFNKLTKIISNIKKLKITQNWTSEWLRHHRSSELLNRWVWDTTGAVNYWTDGCETPQEQWNIERMGGGHSADPIKTPQEQWIIEWMGVGHHRMIKTLQEQWITEWMDVRHHRNSEILNGWVVGTVQIQSRHHRSSELLNGWVWDTKGWPRHHRSSELLNGWVWDTTGAVNYWIDGW